jgi:hypothetical protein
MNNRKKYRCRYCGQSFADNWIIRHEKKCYGGLLAKIKSIAEDGERPAAELLDEIFFLLDKVVP